MPPPVEPPPLQSQEHGGHVSPGMHAGQAHAQPPPLEPPPETVCWHTPVRQGWPSWQGTP